MPNLLKVICRRIKKQIADLRFHKIGASLIALLIICTAVFVVMPVTYTLLASKSLHAQRLLLGEAEASLAFNKLDLYLDDMIPLSQNLFADFSGTLILTDNTGSLVFVSRVLEIGAEEELFMLLTNDQYAVFRHAFQNGMSAYYVFPYYRDETAVALWVSVVYIIIFIAAIYIVKRKMYDPIAKVERILHGVIEGETDFTFDAAKKSDPFSPIFSDLHTLFENMRALTLRETNAQVMKKQAELDALQSQINPHFLYNTLEAIRGQAIEYGLQDIEMMTRSLSKLFRYSISNHNTLVALNEELENVDNYLYIQHLRFNNKFIKVNNTEQDTLDFLVPKLIIQPIVENAIYHGLEMKIGQGRITISAYITQTRLIIDIHDDGLGIPEDDLRALNASLATGNTKINPHLKGSSIGLKNVNARIRLTFGEEYGINVYSTQGVGTDVQLKLPLIRKE